MGESKAKSPGTKNGETRLSLLPLSFLQSSLSSMESDLLPSSNASPLDYVTLFVLRPFLAVSFVFSFILIGWILAWKLVLVHVPLVQEIFGLRKKPVKPKPPHRHRYSKYYSSISRERVDDPRVQSSPS